MNFKPTKHHRSVLLSLQFENCWATKTGSQSSEIHRISSISALFAATSDISVEIFDDSDEAVLLTRFWRSLRPNDCIFAPDIVQRLTFLRQRSWLLDVIPAAKIDLRCVYAVQLWDTGRMWTTGYAPRCLYIDQLDSPTKIESSIDEVSDLEVAAHSLD